MTVTKISSNGSRTAHPGPDGLAKLRREEAKSLIHLACEAMHHTISVAHEMHTLIYRDGEVRPDVLDQMSGEALQCWQTADHYLRMLVSAVVGCSGDEAPF